MDHCPVLLPNIATSPQSFRRIAIEAKIAEQALVLAELKRELNTTVPIGVLPAELLEAIFMQNMLDCLETENGRFISDALPTSWIFVSHVCHHWRDVALSSGRLWSQILAIHPAYDRHCLKHSGQGSLDVNIDTRREGLVSHEILVQIFSELPRIRTLHIHALDLDYSDFVDDSWTTLPAPILESLIVRIGEKRGQSESIAKTLLGRDLPSLEELVIRERPFVWWRSSIPPSLTVLEVDISERISVSCTLEDVETALQSLPVLESLILRNACPSLPSSLAKGTFPLPNLNYLQVDSSSLTRSILFFNHLLLPPTTHVSIQGRLEVGDWSTHSNLITSSIVSRLCGGDVADGLDPLLTFAVDFGDDASDKLTFSGWTESLTPISLTERLVPPFLELSLWIMDDTSHSAIVKRFVEELPLSTVQVLSVTENGEYTPNRISLNVFQNLDSLRYLIAEGNTLGMIPGFLGARHPAKFLRRKGLPFFPHLSYVELINFAFNSTERKRIHRMLTQELVESLKVREECGMRLGRLVLRRCPDFTTFALEPLRKVVGELSVTGGVALFA